MSCGVQSFYYPSIEPVKDSFQGQANFIYTQSYHKYDFYKEASRMFFPSDNLNDRNVSEIKFFRTQFSLVLDCETPKIKAYRYTTKWHATPK